MLPLLLRLIMARVAPRVACPTVGEQLQQNWAVAISAFSHRLPGRFVNGQHVVAVHRLAAKAVAGGTVGKFRIHHHLVHTSRGAVQVILADEQDGQLPNSRHIQPLMESALGHRAVAEETRGHLA